MLTNSFAADGGNKNGDGGKLAGDGGNIAPDGGKQKPKRKRINKPVNSLPERTDDFPNTPF